MTVPSHAEPHAAADDPAAHVAALFDACCGFVCRVLRHLGVHEAALDDAVQDVFVTAHRRWSSFEGRSSARSWLYGIARRIAFRYRRSADARARRFVADDGAAEHGHEPLERVQAAHSLAALLARIDADKRAVFLLVELEGMTAPEAADALGLPLGTVYSRLRAAWQSLGREADREARRELRALRGPEPSSEQRRRMWGLVAGGLLPSTGRDALLGSGGWWVQAKWMVVGAALGAGLLGARAAMVDAARPERETAALASAVAERPSMDRPARGQPPEVERSLVGSPEPRALDRGPSIVPAPAPRMAAAPRARPSAAAPPSRAPAVEPHTADPLTAELALIRSARQALRDGRPTRALDHLAEHERRFSSGQLADERRAVRLEALCAAGRADQAAREAERLGRDPAAACP